MNYSLLADLVLIVHSLYVFFCVGGEIFILTGNVFRWRWIHNRIFRLIHLFAVVFVALEALGGVFCPLTILEYSFREKGGLSPDRSLTFIGRLIKQIIYYEAPSWVFTLLYVGFALIILLTWHFIPPTKRKKRVSRESQPIHNRRKFFHRCFYSQKKP